jgi:hypothetical protein
VQVIETSKKKLGADHPDTLSSMANLAFIRKAQSRDPEAVCLMNDCVQLRQRSLESYHPHYISSSTALARQQAEQADNGATATGRRGLEERARLVRHDEES